MDVLYQGEGVSIKFPSQVIENFYDKYGLNFVKSFCISLYDYTILFFFFLM